MMKDNDKKLILDFAQLQLTPEEFISKYSGDLSNKTEHIQGLLSKCIENKDGSDLEYTMMLANRLRLINSDLVKKLSEILPQDWHTRHEDIVSYFQKLKSPDAIEALYETALKKYTYLEYNDSSALIRKCTWALSAINTTDSINKLRLLSQSSDQVVRDFAQKRIQNT